MWIPNGQYLVFSDIGNNKLKRLDPPGTLSDFLSPPAQTKYNGNTLDFQECLVSCQCGSNGLKVVLTTNGVATPLVTGSHGLKFYSPNNVAVKSDGSIWFTDPGYNSGLPLPPPVPAGFQPGLYVYRFYETNGNATILQVITNLAKPNGICFSPDETKLYVADNGAYANLGTVKVFSVTGSNTVTGGATFCTVSTGIADGFRCERGRSPLVQRRRRRRNLRARRPSHWQNSHEPKFQPLLWRSAIQNALHRRSALREFVSGVGGGRSVHQETHRLRRRRSSVCFVACAVHGLCHANIGTRWATGRFGQPPPTRFK